MAIAFDAAAGTGTNSSTLSFTVGSGSNRVLVVYVIGDLTGDNLSGITYNGVAMSFVQKIRYPGDRWTYLYILHAPATGTHNIVASGLTFCNLFGISYTGANQSSTPDSSSNTNTTGSPWVMSTTVVTTGCWLVGAVYGTDPISTTVTPGVERASAATSGAFVADSNATVGTGSQSLSFNNNAGGRTAVGVMLSLAPVPPAGPTNLKSLDTNVKANIKSINTNLIANVKSLDTNT